MDRGINVLKLRQVLINYMDLAHLPVWLHKQQGKRAHEVVELLDQKQSGSVHEYIRDICVWANDNISNTYHKQWFKYLKENQEQRDIKLFPSIFTYNSKRRHNGFHIYQTCSLLVHENHDKPNPVHDPWGLFRGL